MSDLLARMLKLEKGNTYLLHKVDNLENRSRASNLKFINIPESAEGRDVSKFMADLIPQLLGAENFPSPVAIEQAHRTS